MIEIKRSTFPIPRKLFIFSDKPSLSAGLFNSYHQCLSTQERTAFKRYPFFTKLIDLSDPDFDRAFSRNVRYCIRRATSEGISCAISTDYTAFVSLYQRFLKQRNLTSPLTEAMLAAYGPALLLRTASTGGGDVLAVHSYICDSSIGRVRALHSASRLHDPTISNEERSAIGRANVFLHWSSMVYFRDHGYATYDLGGYAVDTQDHALGGVNKFKDNFGGTLVEESNYVPYWIYFSREIRAHLKKFVRTLSWTSR